MADRPARLARGHEARTAPDAHRRRGTTGRLGHCVRRRLAGRAIRAAAWPEPCRTALARGRCRSWAAAPRCVGVCSGVVCVRRGVLLRSCFFFESALNSDRSPPPLPIDPPDTRSPAVSVTAAMTKAMAAVARNDAERDPPPGRARVARRGLAVDAHAGRARGCAGGALPPGCARRSGSSAGAGSVRVRLAAPAPSARRGRVVQRARESLGRAVHRLADQRHQRRGERRGDPGAADPELRGDGSRRGGREARDHERPHVQAALLLALAEHIAARGRSHPRGQRSEVGGRVRNGGRLADTRGRRGRRRRRACGAHRGPPAERARRVGRGARGARPGRRPRAQPRHRRRQGGRGGRAVDRPDPGPARGAGRGARASTRSPPTARATT